MGLTAKAKNSKESWGMGLLLVFFPEDNSTAAINVENGNSTKLFPSPSSSSMSSSGKDTRRTNSSRLLSKAQSTISICALLVFITLLLFTLSTFEPSTRSAAPTTAEFRRSSENSRRFLSEKSSRDSRSSSSSWFVSQMWRRKPKIDRKISRPQAALQGLGTLYRRGTRAMSEIAVAHVADDVTDDELRLFLRALHRSGVTARADVVLLFASPSSSSSPKFDSVIRDENDSFSELVRRHNKTTSSSKNLRPLLSFDVAQFKAGKKEAGEPLWGKRVRIGFGNNSDESTQKLSYGSVIGFEASELDPENSLSGFLDHVPMSLRRWACYPMLFGRVRRNFKHIMLVDVKNLILLGDQLGLVRNRSPESVLVFVKSDNANSNNKHGKRNSDKATQSRYAVNSAVITGGSRGIRRLSNAMLMEIVRATTAAQHKRRSAVTESGILNQLLGNEFLLKNVKLVKSAESVPDVSELGRNSAAGGLLLSFSGHAVVHRGNSNGHDLKSLIMKQICSFEVDSSVYRDCLAKS